MTDWETPTQLKGGTQTQYSGNPEWGNGARGQSVTLGLFIKHVGL